MEGVGCSPQKSERLELKHWINYCFCTKSLNTFMRRILFLPRLLCGFPFDNNWLFSIYGAFHSCTLITIFCISIYVRLSSDQPNYYNTLKKLNETLRLTQFVLLILTCFGFSFFNRNRLTNLFRDIKKLDKEFNKQGRTVSYSILQIVLQDLIWTFIVLIVFFSVYKVGYEYHLSGFKMFRLTFPLVCVHFFDNISCSFLHVLQAQLSNLTENLELFKERTDAGMINEVELLAELHAGVCNVCKKWNNVLSPYLVFLTTAVLLICVTSLHFILKGGEIMYIAHNSGNISYFLVDIAWLLFWATEQWIMVSTCASAEQKSKEFNKALYELMIEDRSNELVKNEKLQLHIAMKREATFTACGLFPIDFTLIHSMIAAATTYLVILVQFENVN